MTGKEKCDHCDGSGICKKGIDHNVSCPECIEASGLDMAYYKGQVQCAVCKNRVGSS
jgi:hypothetical protein